MIDTRHEIMTNYETLNTTTIKCSFATKKSLLITKLPHCSLFWEQTGPETPVKIYIHLNVCIRLKCKILVK